MWILFLERLLMSSLTPTPEEFQQLKTIRWVPGLCQTSRTDLFLDYRKIMSHAETQKRTISLIPLPPPEESERKSILSLSFGEEKSCWGYKRE